MKKKTCQGRKRENEKKEEKNLIALAMIMFNIDRLYTQ